MVIQYNMDNNTNNTQIEREIIENINEFYNSAVKAEQENKYNVAVTLFFKALAVLADLYIFGKKGKVPSSHSERFRILEKEYPDIYKLLDKNFPFYQDSYRIKLNKEICEVLKNDAEQLIKILKI